MAIAGWDLKVSEARRVALKGVTEPVEVSRIEWALMGIAEQLGSGRGQNPFPDPAFPFPGFDPAHL